MSSPSTLTARINASYGAAAHQASLNTHDKPGSDAIAAAFGYATADLASIPAGANLGLSCGNPLALAQLRAGETLIDLGSGGGVDVFIAARRVGPTGRAIGVDQNAAMLALAERNRARGGYANVEFVAAPITRVALPGGVADCVVSNCVVNLVPAGEKRLVFEEMYRLLRPGGRVAVSDLLARKELPVEMREDVVAHVGCIAGAALVSEYDGWLKDAGFEDVMIVDAQQDCNQYKRCGPGDEEGARDGCCSSVPAKKGDGCCGPSEKQEVPKMSRSTEEADLNEWIGSFKIYAVKK